MNVHGYVLMLLDGRNNRWPFGVNENLKKRERKNERK